MSTRSIAIVVDPLYWSALGQFIEGYATTEAVMFQTLAFRSGVSTKMAQAVFSGVRTDAAIGYIKRIYEAHGVKNDEQEEMEYVFTQLKLITDLRNWLVHYGSFVTTDAGRIASNITRAMTPEKITELRASVEVLESATDDIHKINDHLMSLMMLRGALIDVRARDFPSLLRAWQYIPPPNPQKKAQKQSQKDRYKKPRRDGPR